MPFLFKTSAAKLQFSSEIFILTVGFCSCLDEAGFLAEMPDILDVRFSKAAFSTTLPFSRTIISSAYGRRHPMRI